MKVVIQRVAHASVSVEGQVSGAIKRGLLLLVGFGGDDTEAKLGPLAEKVANMRLFPDERGRFHFSSLEIGAEILLVPQFTLFADISKGRRPEFFGALAPEQAKSLFEKLPAHFERLGIKQVGCGIFGAYMQVELLNDGPVTIIVES